MRKQLEKRLEELKAELEHGQTTLNSLEVRRNEVRETLLRISGAIQVLGEELDKEALSKTQKISKHAANA